MAPDGILVMKDATGQKELQCGQVRDAYNSESL